MLRGVIAPGITFFNSKGELDEAKCKWHLEWMLSMGVTGLFITGTYGSGYLMTLEERVRLFRLAKEVAEHYLNAFVVAHTGCPDTASSVVLTKLATEEGVDAISAISPLYYNYTNSEIKAYYSALAEATNKPVYAYSNPALTGKTLSYNLLQELKEVGIAGVKDSSVNTGLAAAIYKDTVLENSDFQYIPGSATGWLSFRKLDAHAMIAGICNYVPELVVALYNMSYEDERKASRVYELILPLSEKLKFGNSILSSHLNLKARSYEAGYVRAPLSIDYKKSQPQIMEAKKIIADAVVAMKEILADA